jgi:hypothetical protein
MKDRKKTKEVRRLPFVVEEGLVDLFGRIGIFDFLPEGVFGHESAKAREGLDMRAGLIDAGAEKDDEVDGLAVEAVEFHGLGGFSDGNDEGIKALALSVRDGKALADTGGTGRLADQNGLEEMGLFGNFSRLMQDLNQFFNRGIFIFCL